MLKIFMAAIMFFLSLSNVAMAAPQEFTAKSEFHMGDRDSRATAKALALADAKRKIIEQVGVYVKSSSEIKNFELTKDQINTLADTLIIVKDEDVNFNDSNTVCIAVIIATADPDNISPPPEPVPDSEDTLKYLKIAGIEKHNGHYYKLFNDSMTWQDANNRCREIGGHLLTVTSKVEQAELLPMIFLKGTKNFYWTGGFRVTDSWGWITREDFAYENWQPNEPNNDMGNEYILVMLKHGDWADCPAEGIDHVPDWDFFRLRNSGFICEWEALEDINLQ